MTISGRKKKALSIAALLLGLFILAVLVSLSDLHRLSQIGRDLAPEWVLLGAVSAVASFGAFGLCFVSLVRHLIRRSAVLEVLKIGYVSFTFSELLVSAGLSGYAVRSVHLATHGISYLETLIYSLGRVCIHYFVIFLIFLLAVGVFLPFVPEGIGGDVIIFQCFLFAALLAYALRIFLSPAARGRWVRLVGFCLNSVAAFRGKEQILGKEARQDIQEIIDGSIRAIFALGWRTVWPFLLEFAGMGLRFGALYSGFLACGYAVDPAIMVVGFIFGTFWAFFVQLPGQLGVMEGAVSATYTAFGIPFEFALAACILYRLTYTLIPFLIGFLFLPRLTWSTLSAFSKGRAITPGIRSLGGKGRQ
ncbi:MAG: flippase-like domain-containing protein [Desulfohalobiaceae bacterium]|nr:flippase-like domain-containing protein [Desulfohalobiaceae bacterium]